MTQNEKVLAYMEEYGSITTMAAFKIGITRLSARILDLRQRGHNIHGEVIRYTAGDGTRKCYKKYSLMEAADVR